MRLFKTKAGYLARHAIITAGGKWRKVTLHNVTREVAERIAAEHAAKGRKVEIRPGKEGLQVWAYISKKREVTQPATAEDVREAYGREPLAGEIYDF